MALGALWMAQAGDVKVRTAVAMAPRTGGAGVSELDASGYVVARRQATLSSKVTGRVAEVLIEEGEAVSKGAVIARLDNTNTAAALDLARAQLAHSEADLDAARTAWSDARPIYERHLHQYESRIISAQDFDNAKATYDATEAIVTVKERAVMVSRAALAVAQRNHDDTVVLAPFDGIVTVKAAQAGEIVSPMSAGGGFTRTGICTIVDMDSLEVEVDVSENFINRVQPGQPARITLNAYPSWEIPAEVIATVPTADRAKATVRVRVGFRERDQRVLPEMGARVSFLTDSAETTEAPGQESAEGAAVGTVVPPEAVLLDGDQGFVYVVEGDKVSRRSVVLGARTAEGQTVLSGLPVASRVVTEGLDKLADGMKVSVDE
jgi:RND family efflux transporter MFP subunit